MGAELREKGQEAEHPKNPSSQTMEANHGSTEAEHGDNNMKADHMLALKINSSMAEPMDTELREPGHTPMEAENPPRSSSGQPCME
ncbi:hypothetical protein Dimus_013300, partial [Dionaea muscipula]